MLDLKMIVDRTRCMRLALQGRPAHRRLSRLVGGMNRGLLLVLLAVGAGAASADPKGLQWNDDAIDWLDSYEAGLFAAREGNKPAILVFYAEWCATCHSYRQIFADERVASLSRDLAMIRVNVDEEPDTAARFADDGVYVPRVYVLDRNGHERQVFSPHPDFRYFYLASDAAAFGDMMAQAAGL